MRLAVLVSLFCAVAAAAPERRERETYVLLTIGQDGTGRLTAYGPKHELLEPAAGRLGCRAEPENKGRKSWALHARCGNFVQGEGFDRRARVDLGDLWRQARAAGVDVKIGVSAPAISGQSVGPWEYRPGSGHGYWALKDAPPEPLEIEIGLTRAALRTTAAGVAAFLMIPLGLIGAMWWSGRRRIAQNPDAILFDLQLGGSTVLNLSWLVWISLSDAIPVADVAASFAANPIVAFLLASAANALPPLAVLAIGMGFIHHLSQGSRPEQNLGAAVLRSAGAEAAFIIPMSMFISSQYSGSTFTGILGAYGARQAILLLLEKTVPMRIAPLGEGELRDRVFALAKKAKIKLREAYLLLRSPGLEPNAFAMAGERVMISSELVNSMTAREVDAVMAHEVGHIKAGHTAMTGWLMLGSIALGFAYHWMLNRLTPELQWPHYFPVGVLVASMFILWLSRRHEFEADRASGELTGDPEAMISALAKLARITRQPIEWAGWQDRFLTHPSVRRRANALAAHFKIPAERVEQLLATSALADRLAYEARDEHHAERAKSFQQAQRQTRNLHWARRAVMVMLPAAMGYAALRLGTAGHPVLCLMITFLGCVPCLMVLESVIGWLDGLRSRTFPEEIRAAIEKAGFPIPEGAVFVGYSPGGQTRVFNGNDDWDFGFLAPCEDRLLVIGCKSRFSIPDDAILPVETVRGFPGWFRSPRLKLEWRFGTRAGAINFMPYSKANRFRKKAQVQQLRKRLESWRIGLVAAPGAEAVHRGFERPHFGQVRGAWHKSRMQVVFAGLADAGVSAFLAMCVGSMLYFPAGAVAALIAGATSMLHFLPWVIWWAVPDTSMVDSWVYEDLEAEVREAAGSRDSGDRATGGEPAPQPAVHPGG